MPIAALYDIHANLPALEAVMQELRQAPVDGIVVGGDVVPGPMPNETLAYLLSLDIPVHFIQGNCEAEVLGQTMDRNAAAPTGEVEANMRWTAHELLPEHRQAIASWPPTLTLEISGLGRVLFCHATPRSQTEIFTRLTESDRLRPIFEPPHVPVIVCGHTHMQFDRTIGETRVVNAGSVGMPYGEPGAYWLMLGPGVQLRRTRYDRDAAAARIRATQYRHAEDFAANNVLQTPSEEEALGYFATAELR